MNRFGLAEHERKDLYPSFRNSISNTGSAMGCGYRISWDSCCSVNPALPLIVNVDSMGPTRRVSINEHAKAHGCSRRFITLRTASRWLR